MDSSQRQLNRSYLLRGLTDGIPIGLVYLAVSFSIGLSARTIGMTGIQGFFMSLTTIASAGEYAGLQVMASNGTMLEMIILTVVTDIRYVLMGCAFSQRFAPNVSLLNRIGTGALITDEIFALQISKSGYIKPFYSYGAALVAVPLWAIGTYLGIIVGNIIPEFLVSALSVSLYGMFIGIIVPPARDNKAIAICIGASFILSWAAEKFLSMLSTGTRIVILIVVIASAISLLFPVADEPAKEAAQNE